MLISSRYCISRASSVLKRHQTNRRFGLEARSTFLTCPHFPKSRSHTANSRLHEQSMNDTPARSSRSHFKRTVICGSHTGATPLEQWTLSVRFEMRGQAICNKTKALDVVNGRSPPKLRGCHEHILLTTHPLSVSSHPSLQQALIWQRFSSQPATAFDTSEHAECNCPRESLSTCVLLVVD